VVEAKHIDSLLVSRRNLLRGMAAGTLWVPAIRGNAAEQHLSKPWTPPTGFTLSKEDDQFLDELEKANFQFFWDQGDPGTGLIKDRCNVRQEDKTVVASIAATGFGLTAICIADKRGYVPHADARNRVLTTLQFLWKKMPVDSFIIGPT
jgi:hypothetical protein